MIGLRRDVPSPIPTSETKAFWKAAAEGRFVLRFCADCNRTHWYPRAICPHCFSADGEWRPASGRGTIYSYSVMRRTDDPYVLAFVTLEEGPSMLTNIVHCDVDAIEIGQAVRVAFQPTRDGPPVPVFQPA